MCISREKALRHTFVVSGAMLYGLASKVTAMQHAVEMATHRAEAAEQRAVHAERQLEALRGEPKRKATVGLAATRIVLPACSVRSR